MAKVTLKVDGVDYGGWKRVRIRRSIEEVTGTFEITHTEKWSGQNQVRPIVRGAQCTLLIDGQQVIKGYIDSAQPAYDAQTHEITVSGRDKTGDLADCSAKPKQYKNQILIQIAQDICQPFGITVSVTGDQGKAFTDFDVEDETAFEAIERAARHRGLLLLSDVNGNLILGKPEGKQMPAALEFGKNIWRCSGQFTSSNRFSEYILHSQIQGDDNFSGAGTVAPKATAKDSLVTRYRPLIVQAEDQVTGDMLQRRADWEAKVRAGRSDRLSYSVRDWYASGAQLWWPGWMVEVKDSYLKLNRNLLIAGVEFIIDQDGLHADLTLAPKDAFTQFAVPEAKGGAWAA